MNRHLGTPEWKHRSVGESHRAEDRGRCLPRTVQKDECLAEIWKTSFVRIRTSETVAALLPRGQPSDSSPHVVSSPPPHSTSSSLSLPVPRRGVTGQIGPIFKLLLFSRFFGIQLAAPHRAGRLGDVGRERSCIAFSQTLYGPRELPRDWASKQRAFEHS